MQNTEIIDDPSLSEKVAVTVPRKIAAAIFKHAQSAPNEEVIGLIGAAGQVMTHSYPIRNIADKPDQAFVMNSSDQIAAQRTMRERGETLFAIYHSHPKAPALPSPEDLAQMANKRLLCLIVSLNTAGVLEVRGYRISENGLTQEVPLVMLEH